MATRTALPTCAGCGAPLQLAEGVTRTDCTYCGARLIVDGADRTRVAPSPGAGFDPAVVRWLVAASVGAVGVLTSVVFFLARPSDVRPPAPSPATTETAAAAEPAPVPPLPAPASPRIFPAGRGWLLYDVDGDGKDDAIGIFARDLPGFEGQAAASGLGLFLGAASGADGRQLWAVDASIAGADPRESFRALIGDDLLVDDATGVLRGLDPRTAKLLWSRPLAGPARSLCVSRRDALVTLPGGATHRVSLATGTETPAAPEPCDHAYTSQAQGPNFTVVDGAADAKAAGAAAAKLDVRRVLVPVVGAARVVVGTERATGAAAVAVVTGGSLLWSALVAADGAVVNVAVDPVQATVRYDRVVVPYGVRGSPDGKTLHVACFDLASGRRVWEAALPSDVAERPVDVAIAHDKRVFLRTGARRLVVLDLATGRPRLTIGEP